MNEKRKGGFEKILVTRTEVVKILVTRTGIVKVLWIM